ncbi:hypothetical protein Ancab_024106 [Ancistrocladus abbreviatus]
MRTFEVHRSVLSLSLRREPIPSAGTSSSTDAGDSVALIRRHRELRMVDKQLSKGNYKTAVKIVKRMEGKPDGLRGYGVAKKVTCRRLSLEELELHGEDISHLQYMADSILSLIVKRIQYPLEEVSSSFSRNEGSGTVRRINEGLIYELNHFIYKQHEAGHFLVAYLLGVLPREYEVPSMEAIQEKAMEGYVHILNLQSLKSENEHQFSSRTLNKFSCIVLAGLVAVYLKIGHIGGSQSDIDKLYSTFKWLGYSNTEAKAQMRWAVLNTLLILHRYQVATSRLAEAMALGRSIGSCIGVIEDSLDKWV